MLDLIEDHDNGIDNQEQQRIKNVKGSGEKKSKRASHSR